MEAKLFLYAFGIWVVFMFTAMLNGYFRNSFLEPKAGVQIGHVISTIILVCFILLITFLFLYYIRIPYTNVGLLAVGAFWLSLTVLFEFVFGHYVMGNPWGTLLADYNLLKGRIWSLVPLTAFIAPWLLGSILQK